MRWKSSTCSAFGVRVGLADLASACAMLYVLGLAFGLMHPGESRLYEREITTFNAPLSLALEKVS